MVRAPRSFSSRLALLTGLGLAVRLVWALAVRGGDQISGDGLEYHALAGLLADIHRYVEPGHGPLVPTAEKPPLYPLVLALPAALGWHTFAADRIVSCVLGAGTVGVVGLLGRRVAGARAGLVAAAIAAVYPALWGLDSTVRSESLYGLLVALALLAAYGAAERPSARRCLGTGLMIGLAALTRGEALLLVPLLGIPLVRLVPRGRRLRAGALVVAGSALIVLPWLARNWIVFDRPAPISTNVGGLLAGANCPRAYYGGAIGWWACFPRADPAWGRNEAVISSHLQTQAFDYVGDHAGRAPLVMAARLGRTFGLYRPLQTATLESFYTDRDEGEVRAGTVAYYVLAILAALGLWKVRRRKDVWLLLAPLLMVILVSLTTYGSFRFRLAADITIVVLAAVAVAELSARRRAVD
jgi:Dolichyl-phosphate-mannose-protein mannosyltransferase